MLNIYDLIVKRAVEMMVDCIVGNNPTNLFFKSISNREG